MSPASPGPENIHLDSVNIQSSNMFLLEVSVRGKSRGMVLRFFGQRHHIYKVYVCVCGGGGA